MKDLFKLLGIIALTAIIGFSMAACGSPDGGGPFDGRLPGAAVGTPELKSKTDTSVTVQANAPDNGQTVQYALNIVNSVPPGEWQDDGTFSELTANTTYFFFARSKANNSYNAGAASAGLSVKTNPPDTRVELTAGPSPVEVDYDAASADVTFTGATGLSLSEADFEVSGGLSITNVAVAGDTVTVTVGLTENQFDESYDYIVSINLNSDHIKGGATVTITQAANPSGGADERVELSAGLGANVAYDATSATVTFTGAGTLTGGDLDASHFTVSDGADIGTISVSNGTVTIAVSFAVNDDIWEKIYTVGIAFATSDKIRGEETVTVTQAASPPGSIGNTKSGHDLYVFEPAMVDETLKSISEMSGNPALAFNRTLVFENLKTKYTPVAGDIIASDVSTMAPYGFLYKVRTVTVDGNQTTITTEMATIEEAVENADVRETFDLEFIDDGEEVEGVTVVQYRNFKTRTTTAFASSYVPDAPSIGSSVKLEIEKEIDDDIKVEGFIEISAKLNGDIKASFWGGLERFELSIEPGFKAELKTTFGIAGGEMKPKRVKFKEFRFAPVTIPIGIPLVITPKITIECVVTAEGEIQLAARLVEWDYSFVFGVEYIAGTGLDAFSRNTSKPAKYLDSFAIEMSGEVKLAPQVSYMLGLYGTVYTGMLGGFYAKLAGEAEGSIDMDGTPGANAKLSLSCGLEFGAEAELEILGFHIGKLSKNFLTIEWTIWEINWSLVTNLAQWNDALAAIRAGGNNKSYTLIIAGNIAGITPDTSTTTGFGTASNISVTLRTLGTRTLDTANVNGSMFYLRTGQTLIIDGEGLTLRGRTNGIAGHTSDNNTAIICVQSGATLELKNGTISGNTTPSSYAGAVYMYSGTFNMRGGEISGNTSQRGGVNVGGGTFTMYGGVISGNTGTNTGIGAGGVNVGGTFRIVNGTIYGTNESDESLRNTYASPSGGAVLYASTGTAQRGTFSGTTWVSKGNLTSPFNSTLSVVNGEFYPNTNNLTASNLAQYNAALDIIRSGGNDEDYTITIAGDIAGITPMTNIDFGTATGISVTLTTLGATASAPWTLDTANVNGSMFYPGNGQTLVIDGEGLTLRGRTNGIAGHTSDNNTAIICVQSGATLELKNGTISGNTTPSSYAGAVYMYSGTFNMRGGEISGNTSQRGGVNVGGGTFTMYGGVISGNTGTNTGIGAGGVNVGGTFRIVNGTIYGTNESDESLRNTYASPSGGAVLYNGGTAQRGTFSGTTWVSKGNLTSPLNGTLSVVNGEFYPNTNSFTASNLAEYNAALELIRNGGNDRDYTITIAGDIAGITPMTNIGFGTATGISVTLTTLGATASAPWTLDTANANGSMFYPGSGQTLIIDGEGLTLRGRTNGTAGHTGDNGIAIIQVQSGATLELKNGTISGNNASTSYAGAVYMYGGTFNMRGGEISGNTSARGGVNVGGGTFTMYGGVISGNTGTSPGIGAGGVTVGGGTFRIVNGTIYGTNESNESLRNTIASPSGGAVLYRSSGTTERGYFTGDGTMWIPYGSLISPLNTTLNVVDGRFDPAVTGVTLSQNSATLYRGSTMTLTATVQPSNASYKFVSWSGGGAASVTQDGVVTAGSVGQATITVTTADGSFSASCSITVEPVPSP